MQFMFMNWGERKMLASWCIIASFCNIIFSEHLVKVWNIDIYLNLGS